MKNNDHRYWRAIAMLGTASLLATLVILFNGRSDVAVSEKVVLSRSRQPLRFVLISSASPSFRANPRPAVVAIPPYSISPEAMEIIGVELARRGTVCAIPDFFGKSPDESRQQMGRDSLEVMKLDVLSIIDALRAMPGIDPDRIGVCGHSVGGHVAIVVGMADPRVKASVPIGMEATVYENIPQNVNFLSGFYDEIHFPMALWRNFEKAVGMPKPAINRVYGDFKNGTARQLTLVPTTDHFIETFDPFLIRSLLDWYARAFEESQLNGGRLKEFWRRVASFILMLAVASLYGLMLSRAISAWLRKGGQAKPNWLILRLQAVPLLILLPCLWMVGRTSVNFRLVAIDLIIILLFVQEFLSHHRRIRTAQTSADPFQFLRPAFLMLVVLGVAVLLAYGLVSVPDYARFPSMIWWYPVFVLNMSVLMPIEIWSRNMPWFFSETVAGFYPGRLYFLILGIVIIAPGSVARVLDRLAEVAVTTVRSRISQGGIKPQTGTHRQNRGPVWIKIAVLVFVSALLSYFIYRRIREGMLTWETAWLAIISLSRFAIIPFVIAYFILRSRFFKRVARWA